MKITSDKSLENFEFWGGASDLAAALTSKELSTVESILEEEYSDGIDETTLNDLFAYEGDTIAEWLSLPSEEYILGRSDADYLLDQAKELLEKVREENYNPEFTLADTDEFRNSHGDMSEEDFVNEGWKQYVVDNIDGFDGTPIEEMDSYLADFEDTLSYIKLEILDGEISGVIKAFKDRIRESQEVFTPHGESMVDFRDRLVEQLESSQNLMFKEDSDLADTLVEDINNCDDLCTGEKTKVEEEDEDYDR